MREKLKEIVRAGIDGGWSLKLNQDNDNYLLDCWGVEKGVVVAQFAHKTILVHYKHASYSIPDIFSNHTFMRALLGEETYWEETSDEYGLGTCYNTGIPTYIYHIQQLFTLPTDKERVEYVYRTWKEGI